MEVSAQSLKQEWQNLLAQEPKIRIRNAAEKLGVSEVELLATQCGENVIRLEPKFSAILAKIESLGKVMALTRNNDVVHERKGVYLNSSLDNPHVGLFVGEDIDLRIFFSTWKSVFAVSEGEGKTLRKSIQFFAKDGEAIHKIFLTNESNETAYDVLVQEFTSVNQNPEEEVVFLKNEEVFAKVDEVDVKAFQQEWLDLKDTHHFFGLLKKHRLSRTLALQLAPKGNYAIPLNNTALEQILNEVSQNDAEIMVFVGNKGMIQIHTGKAKKIVPMEQWLNVLDPDFNLHVAQPNIAQSWIVRKPTEDGIVTSLECFDAKGEQIVQLFGKRKPGIPELKLWQDIVEKVEQNSKLK